MTPELQARLVAVTGKLVARFGVPVTNAAPVPLLFDDFSYPDQASFLSRLAAASGGSAPAGSERYTGTTQLLNSVTGQLEMCIQVDTRPVALHNGKPTLRWDFCPVNTVDSGPTLHRSIPATDSVDMRFLTKYDDGSVTGQAPWGTAGIAASNNAQAYKLFGWGGTRDPGGPTEAVADGRYEITNGTDDEVYEEMNSAVIVGNPNVYASQPLVRMANDDGSGRQPGWHNGLWNVVQVRRTVLPDGKTLDLRAWRGVEGSPLVYLGSARTTTTDGSLLGVINDLALGRNYNQKRDKLISLWHCDLEAYDTTKYHNPFGVPTGDIADLPEMVGVL